MSHYLGLTILTTILTSSIASAFNACPTKSPLTDLGNILETASCGELSIGQTKVVNFDGSSPTTVEHKYALDRTRENEYTVKLNLIFQADSVASGQNNELDTKMRSRIKKCLEWINPHLIGPNSKHLKFELIDSALSNSSEYKDIKTLITVSEKAISRENSKHYSLETSCPVIAHELLHLTGLTDEYQETDNIKWYEKDCRSMGPPDSIMANHEEGTDLNEGDPWNIITGCRCKGSNCKEYSEAQAQKLRTCPPNYEMVKTYAKLAKESSMTPEEFAKLLLGVTQDGMGTGIGKPKIKNGILLSIVPSARIPNSFLYPAHFQAIVYPGCKAKNSLYYSCARDSYYRPYNYIEGCHSKPTDCGDPEKWLK
jgi:hypothetical protein